MKPITPEEAVKRHEDSVPDFVIGIVNDLIVERMGMSRSFVIHQKDIVNAIRNSPEYKQYGSPDMFKAHWMDFEPKFRAVGWKVDYDSPAYNENYEAFYRFTR
jgi:hypothetical protein